MILRSIATVSFAVFAIAVSGCCVGRYSGRQVDCHDGKCGVADECAQCGDVGCHDCVGPGPIHALKGLIHGAGCGDVYWDEWISDPPYRCDPCDDHGNWIGPKCCPAGILHSWRSLWGRRGIGCTCGACLEHPGFAHHDGEIIDGEVIYEGPVIDEVVEPAESSGETILRPTPAEQTSGTSSVKKRQVRSHKVYYERAGATQPTGNSR